MYVDSQVLKEHVDKIRGEMEGWYYIPHLWRAKAYAALSAKSVTGPVRQAEVFAAMLRELPPVLNAGEAIVGSTQGALGQSLPKGIAETEYVQAMNVVGEKINLTFGSHFDHACPDYEAAVTLGIGGILGKVEMRRKEYLTGEQKEYLDALDISLRAFQGLVSKYEAECRDKGLLEHSKRLANLVNNPPTSFWEALQLIWLIDLTFALEGRGAMSFGRMDQYLYPFYRHDLEQGHLTYDQGLLLIEHFYAKLGEPMRLNAINNISVGGLTPQGEDGTNELSYILLKAADTIRSPRHNLTARWHSGTPKAFKEACFNLIKTGIGFPAIVNDDVLSDGLVRLGYPPKDARDYCFVGCIETFFPGKTGPWADSRLNMLKVLENLLLRLAYQSEIPSTYEYFEDEYMRELAEAVENHAEQIRKMEAQFDYWERSSPFLSALTQDCIFRATDVNTGGAIYAAMHGIAGMGLATVTDSLNSIRVAVYRDRKYSIRALVEILQKNFLGKERDRSYLLNRISKYGNGCPDVDRIAQRVVSTFGEAVFSQRNYLGGRFLPLLAANINNIPAGREVGATPDGRLTMTPVSDAASPHFGRDRNGPTGVMSSLSNVDYVNSIGGNVVNMKITLSEDSKEQGAFISLVSTYFENGGLQMQFNSVDRETLLKAQSTPDEYGSLLVRVSGFSAYFTELSIEVQNDIISRTEHTLHNSV